MKNLSIKIIVQLIILSTPQFLIFTFPFATLSAVAMQIGDLASKNEILAMRSLGISLRRIYRPIFVMSIFTCLGTYFIADRVNPWAADRYRKVYSRVISSMPTIALKPNSVSTIGSVSISVGDIIDGNIQNIRIFDVSNREQAKLVVSKTGHLEQNNKHGYLYQLILDNPQIMFTSDKDEKKYSLAQAEKLTYSIDMSSLLPTFGEPSSSQIRTKEIYRIIKEEKSSEKEQNNQKNKQLGDNAKILSQRLDNLNATTNLADLKSITTEINSSYKDYKKTRDKNNSSYRKIYYETEYYKRIALSLACIVLGLLAFPLSFFRVKHGRLIGFAISMVISVAYWSLLFFAQVSALTKVDYPVWIKLMLPDAIFLVIALIILYKSSN